MLKFTEAFQLGLSQAEVDFVDVDLDADTPLYLDPYALTTRNDAWSEECHALVVTYFEAVLNAVKAGARTTGARLLSHLNEPEETRLGVSKGHSKGRGVGEMQAAELFDAMAASKAAKTGLLDDLSDFALFVPGIGQDKISDMTTNIIRRPLLHYTKEQADLFGIPTRQVSSGFYWTGSEWSQGYVHLPIYKGRKILLVPKFTVRYSVGADASKYRNHFVLEFLQAEHLSAGGSLVTTIRDKKGNVKRTVVYKKDVDDHYPKGKDFLAEFSKAHPKIIDDYKTTLRAAGGEIPNLLVDKASERKLASYLSNKLSAIPAGVADANSYHSLMIGIITFIFFPNLIYPKKESAINEGRKRIDITYTNGKQSGIFYRLALDADAKANVIHVECKNYSTEIANAEFDQLIGRSDPLRGKVGLLLYRNSNDRALVIRRARDAAKSQQALILPLDDEFVKRALQRIAEGDRQGIDSDIDMVYRDIIS